ncbi:hypothetical protein H0E87_008699 [Populus deltoides]|uniref:Uncharacterized protein n=1 Tax=Populus deltoides TaxID=3696 RepID=A0A8T2Z120_POPDE|nr:hypothetical protein H0E87_008699 [Populus deltoides]
MAAFSLLSLFHPNPSIPKMTTKPLAVLNNAYKMQVPYELQQGQTRIFHQLPSGLNMEVIEQKGRVLADKENNRSPGNRFGFDSYAVSLLGQGESDAPASPVAGSLQSNLLCFIGLRKSPFTCTLTAMLFGLHSRKENAVPRSCWRCSCVLCTASGNSGLVWRYLFSKPVAAFKVTRSLAAKAFQTDLSLCKETFFTSTMEDHLVKRYQALMKESSRMPLFDLRKLNSSLPVPSVLKSSIEVLVLGANDDFIVVSLRKHIGIESFPSVCDRAGRIPSLAMSVVMFVSELLSGTFPSDVFLKTCQGWRFTLKMDTEGLNETGRFYGVSPICVEGVAHDMMLDCSWEKGARAILSWLLAIAKYAIFYVIVSLFLIVSPMVLAEEDEVVSPSPEPFPS